MATKVKPCALIYWTPYLDWSGVSQSGNNMGIRRSYKSRNLISSVRTGVGVPAFKRKIELGLDATSPYSASYESAEVKVGYTYLSQTLGIDPPDGPAYVTYGQFIEVGDSWFPLNWNSFPSIDTSERDRVNNEAVARFSDKVRERMQTISGPTALGEIRQTLELLRKPNKVIEKLLLRYNKRVYSKLRKKRFDAKKTVEYARKKYLEFTFAVTPLVSDVRGAAEALGRMGFATPLDVRTSVSRIIPIETRSSVYNSYFYREMRVSCRYQTTVVGKIKSSVIKPPGTTSRLARLLGFSWDEFLPTAWELVPYSFVIDYFTNVNSILSSRYASASYLAWRSTTEYTKREKLFQNKFVREITPAVGRYTVSVDRASSTQDGMIRQTRVSIQRYKGTPSIQFMLEMPSPKQLFNVSMLGSIFSKTNKR